MDISSRQSRSEFRQILIPTDFSPCALSALRCAISWNNKDRVRLHVYHRVAGMPEHWNDMSDGEQETFTSVVHALETMHQKFEAYKTVLREREIPYRLVYSGGDLIPSLARYIQEEEIDYVFMGSHGKSAKGLGKIGSNAVDAIKALDTPVLVAKDYIIDQHFNHVVFASNFDLMAMPAFDRLLEMVSPFSPTIHLLNIDTPRVFKSPRFLTLDAMHDFEARAAGYETIIHFYQELNVGKGIIEFCEEKDIDLIAISESPANIFGNKKVSKSLRFLIENAKQPIFFIQGNGEAAEES